MQDTPFRAQVGSAGNEVPAASIIAISAGAAVSHVPSAGTLSEQFKLGASGLPGIPNMAVPARGPRQFVLSLRFAVGDGGGEGDWALVFRPIAGTDAHLAPSGPVVVVVGMVMYVHDPGSLSDAS